MRGEAEKTFLISIELSLGLDETGWAKTCTLNKAKIIKINRFIRHAPNIDRTLEFEQILRCNIAMIVESCKKETYNVCMNRSESHINNQSSIEMLPSLKSVFSSSFSISKKD